jgi:SAM-dependent methyltransferase
MAAELNVDTDTDQDSGIEDLSSIESSSLRSSLLTYTYENGRRYHAFGTAAYPIPNDEIEQDRMDLLHHIWRTMLGGELLHKKPPSPPQLVLDVGTGTGIWAIDIADEYPEAKVIGTDISPIQPQWVPPNCHFYVDDAEADWTYDNVDLVHGRSLAGSLGDWPRFYRQSFESLKPGGRIEMQEHETWISTVKDTTPPWTAEWNVSLNRASEMFGKKFPRTSQHAEWMQEAGFVDIEDMVQQVPIGPWAKGMKDLGRIHLMEMVDAVEPYTLALYTKVLNHSLDETKTVIEMVKKEFTTRGHHLYVNYHFISARKPLS